MPFCRASGYHSPALFHKDDGLKAGPAIRHLCQIWLMARGRPCPTPPGPHLDFLGPILNI